MKGERRILNQLLLDKRTLSREDRRNISSYLNTLDSRLKAMGHEENLTLKQKIQILKSNLDKERRKNCRLGQFKRNKKPKKKRKSS